MVAAGFASEARVMRTDHPAPYGGHALAASAHELQRAAGHVQKHAAASEQVPALGATLAHIEEALDRLSVAMLQMANGVVEWSAEQDPSVDEDALPPPAQALCFHLRAVADALRAPRDACSASRMWTRRLLDTHPDAARDPELRLDAPDATRGSSGQMPEDTSNGSLLRS
jgi:hypothetical protein